MEFTMANFKIVSTTLMFLSVVSFGTTTASAQDKKPNVVYFLVDNLGMG
jgi:hypothetical protein